MPLGTVQRRGLVGQVVAQLQELIGSGEWPVGSRLPPEQELGELLGVGRSTVREAVRALSHTGVIEVRQGDGSYVTATSDLSGVLRQGLAASDPGHVLEIRRALDVEAAALAAERHTAADLRALEGALRTREEAWQQGDPAAWVETDLAFHVAVVAAAHNPLLEQLYADFAEALEASIAASVSPGLDDGTYVDHGRLLDAIRSGEPERAAREARQVLGEVEALLDL
ncbi:MAG TPA: FadR/GntR family transcriptional regulator [Segeticoccus sp.]|uniref:FadR/GntR family transcriptional regulator n=1 Tax=Segeticoccus sp. TaxID=2706531 RepID=UPI002D7EF151|nr:FadR/GntR family transcriptional regulator [Segeticoccus sp.]HET8601334.1 FadR/GntR family transcriptional regulator [Segeticoccus sp.]